jgi:hypothetical protein
MLNKDAANGNDFEQWDTSWVILEGFGVATVNDGNDAAMLESFKQP